MGCVTSKQDINDLHPNVFQVSNVDDLGNPLSSGQLEVTCSELVLHQRGKPPVRWPLKSLRRYGYDSQVFSFEAGRRCPTGSGIYAFSCHRAEQLFNFVQAQAQIRCNEDAVGGRDSGTPTPSVAGGRPQDANYLEPTPLLRHSLPSRLSMGGNGTGGGGMSSSSRLSSVGSSNGGMSPSSPLTTNNNYANEEIFRLEEKCRSLAVPEEEPPAVIRFRTRSPTLSGGSSSAIPSASTIVPPNDDDVQSPVYMNVVPGVDLTLEDPLLDEEDDEGPKHCYANLTPGDHKNRLSLTVPTPPPPPPPPPPPLARHVNYIILDLDHSGPPPSPGLHQPDSPPLPLNNNNNNSKMSEGYVTIDFDRTIALTYSTNPGHMESDPNECLRKTRHDSTINDLIAPISSRQSASLSD